MRKFTLEYKSYNLYDKLENNSIVSSTEQDLKSVLDTVPDLKNDEIECIVGLQVGESLVLDGTTIIRTV